MSTLVDTSVIVRAVVGAHEDHEPVAAWLRAHLTRTSVVTSTHALAETFNVLSGRMQVPHAECRRLVARIRREFQLVSLAQGDYADAIEMTMNAGRSGPTVYDALHVVAANKAGATRVAACDARSFPFLLPPSRFFNPLDP